MGHETDTIKNDIKVTVKNEWDRTDAVTWTERFREIIDTALQSATTLEEFAENMQKENIRVGKVESQEHGNYFVFCLLTDEQSVYKRSYRLGEGYSYDDIIKKLDDNLKKEEEAKQTEEESYRPKL